MGGLTKSWQAEVSRPKLLTEDSFEEVGHFFPGGLVGLGIVSRAFRIVVAGSFDGEAMDGARILDQFVIHFSILHLSFERLDVFSRYIGVVSTMEDQDFTLNIFTIVGVGGVETTVEAHDAFNCGTAAS